jgi:hypothetical protein
MIAAAAATAKMATPMAQIDTPQSIPQTGAHGSQGAQGPQEGHGPGPLGAATQGPIPTPPGTGAGGAFPGGAYGGGLYPGGA